jgi:hypothetical protein
MKRKSFLANFSVGILLVLALISLPTTSRLVDANASPAFDVQTTDQVINIPTQTCSQATPPQECTPLYTTSVNVLDGPIDIQFTASPQHCSSISVKIKVDNGAVQQTAFLAPGVSSPFLSFGNFTAGLHTITIQAIGQTTGCNTGYLLNWMGSITVRANFPPPGECLQDNSNGNLVLFNATTGAFQFTNCQGLVQSGVGVVVTKGQTIAITQNTSTYRFSLKLDRSTRRGTASLQIVTPQKEYLIADSNYTNNSCVCGGSN